MMASLGIPDDSSTTTLAAIKSVMNESSSPGIQEDGGAAEPQRVTFQANFEDGTQQTPTSTNTLGLGESSSSHTGLSTTTSAGSKRMLQNRANLSEKKLRRLEKNRLSAQACRRRKKEAAQQLEREINLLESENLRLRLQLKIGEEAEESTKKEAEMLTEGLDALLKSGASESDVYSSIEEFKEKFADYGRDRRSAIEFHLRNVERLLMPTTTTTVAMRAMEVGAPEHHLNPSSNQCNLPQEQQQHHQQQQQPVEQSDQVTTGPGPQDPASTTNHSILHHPSTRNAAVPGAGTSSMQSSKFPTDSNVDPKRMFQFLVTYLGVTTEQAAALKDSRKVAQELDAALAKSLGMLNELKVRLTQCVEDLETEFDSVRAILTPTQVAKFVVWISNNGACMHMLNELWGKVYGKTPSSLLDEEDAEAFVGEFIYAGLDH